MQDLQADACRRASCTACGDDAVLVALPSGQLTACRAKGLSQPTRFGAKPPVTIRPDAAVGAFARNRRPASGSRARGPPARYASNPSARGWAGCEAQVERARTGAGRARGAKQWRRRSGWEGRTCAVRRRTGARTMPEIARRLKSASGPGPMVGTSFARRFWQNARLPPHIGRPMSHPDIRSAVRPETRPGDGGHRRLRRRLQDRLGGGLRHRALHAAGLAGLRDAGDEVRSASSTSARWCPGATLAGGARVPGTSFELDPVQAAYNIGVQVRWLDFNDTWLAAEWGHPSDNLGAILAVADYLSRKALREGGKPITVRDVLGCGDQGARDPGRLRAAEQLQPRRPRPRDPGAPGLDRRRHRDARRRQGRDHQRGLA